MNFGLYCAYLGMRSRQQRLDLIANNIANASTAGFKADHLLYRSVEAAEVAINQSGGNTTATASNAATPGAAGATTPTPAANATTAANATANGAAGTGANAALLTPVRYGRDVGVITTEATDFSAGSIRETGRSLDVALEGDGFLVVQTPRGERYTRQGSLTLDESGQLITQRGDLVIGQNGPITVPPGQVSIGEDGSVSANGQTVGQLKLVRFADPNSGLTKEGSTLFMATGQGKPLDATGARVVQGALEMSNVNSLTEMVAMMQNTREFDSLQRSVSTMMNDIGRTVANNLGNL